MRTRDVLISAEELLQSAEQPTILDVRWRLDETDGRPAYLAGHIPGAVYVSLEDDLSDHSRLRRGRHPLPSGADLQTAARRWGVRAGRQVVVYDDWNRAGSSRAWWVLTAAGLTDVRILDGGFAAWTRAGGVLEHGEATPEPGDVTLANVDLYSGARPTLTADEVADSVVGTGPITVLLDARAPERYRGEVEPVDPVAGHVPGARNLPSTALLDADGTFREPAAIAALLAARGFVSGDTVGVYCGSGVTASVVLAALNSAGIEGALFPGSWSQWSAEDGRPIATADEPA